MLRAVISALLVAIFSGSASADSVFTYQGLLHDGGSLATGDYAVSFSLWDAPAGGNQIASTININPVSVADGKFSVELDFGAAAFTNADRWLEIVVNGSTLDPRQRITRAPYSIQTRGIFVDQNENVGIGTLSPQSPMHVVGDTRIDGRTALGNAAAIGMNGTFSQFDRVHDFSHTIQDFSSSPFWTPLICVATLDPQVDLDNSQIYCNDFEAQVAEGNPNDILLLTGMTAGAVHNGTGRVVNMIGDLVFADSRSTGEIAHNTGLGVVAGGHFESEGLITENIGLSVLTGHAGLAGSVLTDIGVLVRSPRTAQPMDTHYGIYLEDQDLAQTTNYAIYSEGGDVFFNGNLDVSGTLTKGGGSFKIDHPLDPENKYLSHSFVESPDMMNIYNGTVTTDAAGYATVTMPDWFEALNRDFRYQLTVVDGADSDSFAMAKIVREIKDGAFRIRTSDAQTTVSWQVTGIRQDAYANANRIRVEEDKPIEKRGTYLHPDAYGRASRAGGKHQAAAMTMVRPR